MVTTIKSDIHCLFGLLETSSMQEMSFQDISVAYLGLDWKHAYATLDRLALKVDQLQRQGSLLTLVMPRHLIKDLANLETDLDAHAEAVCRGRINKKEREHIRSLNLV